VSNSFHSDLIDNDIYTQIVSAIRETGYFIANNVFTPLQLNALLNDLISIDKNSFHRAGIGREFSEHTNDVIRRDNIFWLERNRSAASFYWDWMEQLRIRINREFYLGLFEYECLYAHYAAGDFYKKHLDAFIGSPNRKLSSVLYLNPDWQQADGGEFVLYEENSDNILMTVLPSMGTLVIFLSEIFPHEVRVARRSRYSLTGWFRVNNSSSLHLDVPA